MGIPLYATGEIRPALVSTGETGKLCFSTAENGHALISNRRKKACPGFRQEKTGIFWNATGENRHALISNRACPVAYQSMSILVWNRKKWACSCSMQQTTRGLHWYWEWHILRFSEIYITCIYIILAILTKKTIEQFAKDPVLFCQLLKEVSLRHR